MTRHVRGAGVWLSGMLALLLVGCGATNPSAALPPGATSPPPSDEAPDPSFEALVADSIAFRREFGLRADEDWVRRVAADPSSRTSYGYPLTAAEEAELDSRAAAVEELGPILQDYGARHPDEYAGMYVDQERGGVLVVLFTADLEEHGRAIAQLVRPGAAIELRAAPQSTADLEALMERISADDDLPGLGVFVLEVGLDEMGNRVRVGVSTERGDAQGVFTGRYGTSVLVEVLDPTGAFLKPRGTVVGRVVDPSGAGVRAAVGAEPLFGDFGLDAVGPPETNPDGSFRLDDQLTGRWRLTAFAEGFADTSIEVDVPPGAQIQVEIVLERS